MKYSTDKNYIVDVIYIYLTIKGLCWFLPVVLGCELIVLVVGVGRFGLLFGGENIYLGLHLKCARLKLMISKAIQELNKYPLWIIPDYRHLVVISDDFLCCLIPLNMHHECSFCHYDGRSWLESLPHQIFIIEHGAFSSTLEDIYCGTRVHIDTPRMDNCYASISVLYIR